MALRLSTQRRHRAEVRVDGDGTLQVKKSDEPRRRHDRCRDFRRFFVRRGQQRPSPAHRRSTTLGRLNLHTTRGYTAVSPEHIVTADQAFIERRRQLGPFEEAKAPTATSGPTSKNTVCYAVSPSVSATARTQRPRPRARLRPLPIPAVDPARLGRIAEVTANAEQRLAEAKERAWRRDSRASGSITHLRIRQSEAQHRLSHDSNPFGGTRTP